MMTISTFLKEMMLMTMSLMSSFHNSPIIKMILEQRTILLLLMKVTKVMIRTVILQAQALVVIYLNHH